MRYLVSGSAGRPAALMPDGLVAPWERAAARVAAQ